MNAAAQYAALTAVESAAKAARDAIKAKVMADHQVDGADRWRTSYGTVIVKGLDARTSVAVADEEAFLDYVAEHYPTEVETVTPPPVVRVRPAFRALLLDRLVVEYGDISETVDVVDPATGEVADWTRLVDPPAPTISMAGGRDEAATQAKKDAAELFRGGLLELMPSGGEG